MSEFIGRAYRKRPDPSDPWRYVCATCFSPMLDYRTASRTVYCNECGKRAKVMVDLVTDAVMQAKRF